MSTTQRVHRLYNKTNKSRPFPFTLQTLKDVMATLKGKKSTLVLCTSGLSITQQNFNVEEHTLAPAFVCVYILVAEKLLLHQAPHKGHINCKNKSNMLHWCFFRLCHRH
eukprot:TRINITY_DN4250_c0_g1_i3.p1 TRINITY_DN4250_c0_g1~~TRINITY_DN4250_c0_g1_i3.p1  ORF type:complete len:109 (+),score=5.67 TRINITY_DN4250_c0_g1_i3:270-596(+)